MLDNEQNDSKTEIKDDNEIIDEIFNNKLIIKKSGEQVEITSEDLSKSTCISQNQNEEEEEQQSNNEVELNKFLNENIIIDIFHLNFTGIALPEEKNSLRDKIYKSKRYIKYYCKNLSENFSKYILVIFGQKIDEFIDILQNEVTNKINSIEEFLQLKNAIEKTGGIIRKIIEEAFNKTSEFDITSILVLICINLVEQEKKVNFEKLNGITELKLKGIKEKNKFDTKLNEWRCFFDKVQSGEIHEDVEVLPENEKSDTCEAESSTDQEESNFKHKVVIQGLNNVKIDNEQIPEINKSSSSKGNLMINNYIDSTKEQEKKNKKNKKGKKKKEKDGENEINTDVYKSLEDLVNYINGDENKKSKKKKKRKKKIKRNKKYYTRRTGRKR